MLFFKSDDIHAEEMYLESIKGVYPSKFFDLFIKSNKFHDWFIFDFQYCSETVYFNEKSDKVLLSLVSDFDSDNFFVRIEFFGIKSFKFDSHAIDLSQIWEHYDGAQHSPSDLKIGEIFHAEIRVINTNNFVFELVTDQGNILSITFKKVRFVKNRI